MSGSVSVSAADTSLNTQPVRRANSLASAVSTLNWQTQANKQLLSYENFARFNGNEMLICFCLLAIEKNKNALSDNEQRTCLRWSRSFLLPSRTIGAAAILLTDLSEDRWQLFCRPKRASLAAQKELRSDIEYTMRQASQLLARPIGILVSSYH